MLLVIYREAPALACGVVYKDLKILMPTRDSVIHLLEAEHKL